MCVIGLPVLSDDELVPLFTSTIGLRLIVTHLPGGLAQIGDSVRTRTFDVAERRHNEPTTVRGSSGAAGTTLARRRDVESSGSGTPESEIVGPIGTNGTP